MITKKLQPRTVAYSKQELLLNTFQAMSEAKFTSTVLVPLFKKMGYEVDEHGGVAEGGKDLICWRNGDFNIRELIVVQVKKTTPSAAASSSNSFAGIVNQLQQASEKEVHYKTGESKRPSGIYFITPFQVDMRSLETRFEAYRELSNRRVRILDGASIVDALLQLLPKLADHLCGDEFSIKHDLLSNISNADLLSALNCRRDRNIDEFYCDLDFGVGRVTSKLFFSLNVAPSIQKYSLPFPRWITIASCAKRIKSHTGVDVVIPGIDQVNSSYGERHDLYNADENQQIVRQVRATTNETEALLQLIRDEYKEIVEDTAQITAKQQVFGNKKNIRSSTIRMTEEERKRSENLKLARSLLEDGARNGALQLDPAHLSDLRGIFRAAELESEIVAEGTANQPVAAANRLNSFHRSINLFNALYKVLSDDRGRQLPEPQVDFSINGAALAQELLRYQREMAEGLACLAKQTFSQAKIKIFLIRCQDIFSLVGSVLDETVLAEAIGFTTKQAYSLVEAPQRIHMPIKDIFATRINCAVFGEAGAGKSTTLYQYATEAAKADDQDEITMFLPLTRLLFNHQRLADDDTVKPILRFEAALSRFLNLPNKASQEDILKFLRAKKRLTFILDGVDEVIKSAPWIVDAIHELPKIYSNSQVIISARSSGRYLDSTDFLCLTLLPFTPDQVHKFIEQWFPNAAELSAKVQTHLNNMPALCEIVTNPLLATVLCVLAENGVPLPESELGMYAERMKLLLGHYDIHKKSKRLLTHHSILESVARKLAFHLHRNNIRALSQNELEEVAISTLGRIHAELSEDQLRIAVGELIDPCNVLEPMTDDGAFGFGHLRFQEYLCATELCLNRGIELKPLLQAPWWRSVLVLFARLTDDIRYIIEEVIYQQHSVSKYRDTLLALIDTRPKSEKKRAKATRRKSFCDGQDST